MMLRAHLLAYVIFLLISAPAVLGQDVRVRLLDLVSPQEIAVAGREGGLELFAGEFDDPLARLASGEEAIISRASNQLHVKIGETGLFANTLRIEPAGDAGFALAVREGSAARASRTYPGRLLVSTGESDWEIKLINEVALEDYVASVVSSEYGLNDLEGTKAMAVIVRTYTLAVLGKYGSDYDHVDHTLSQVYEGSDNVSELVREAARATEGQVLTHDGRLIRAVYFSASGGHTANNESVWEGEPLPYLRGKPDPYGVSSPHARWTARISRQQLLRRLADAYGSDVEGFLLGDRSNDGRVATVELLLAGGGRREIRANDFRLLVIKHFGIRSLRSTLFEARREGDEYVFEGRGFGHGVGLSQWGAHDMAQRGSSYREILDFYYTGAQLDMLEDADPLPQPSTPAAEEQNAEDVSEPSRRIGW